MYFLGKKHLQGSLRAGKVFTIDPLLASRVIGICVQSSSKIHGAISSSGRMINISGNLLTIVRELNQKSLLELARIHN